MANQDTINGGKDDTNPPSPLYSIGSLPSAFTFSLGIAMAIISIAVIILRAAVVISEGLSTHNVYYLGILPETRDIAAFIPVVSLFIALSLNIRRFGVTMAQFLVELTEKIKQQTERSKQKQFDKGHAEASVEWNNWVDRKEAAEAKGEPFDEPRPGSEEDTDSR